MEKIIEVLGSQIWPILGQLEWLYVFSFILISLGVQKIAIPENWKFIVSLKKRFKVALIGLIYAPLYYLIVGMKKEEIGLLFASYLFTFVFHKLLVDVVLSLVKEKMNKLRRMNQNLRQYE